MTKSRGMLIASAAAGLILAGAVAARAESATKAGGDEVMCAGINACKGQGACASAENSCAGKNACKGHGVVKTTAEECKAKGGKIQEQKQ